MKRLLVSLVLATCYTPALAGDGHVMIHVVNGKNGKPVSNEHVLVFQG